MERPELIEALGREVDEGALRGALALLPLGSIEYHGPHSPLGTDTFIARELARRVAARVRRSVVLPDVGYTACEPETRAFAGTVCVDADLLARVLEGILRSLFAAGVSTVVALNAHNGNIEPLATAQTRISAELEGRVVLVLSWWELLPAEETGRLGGFSEHGGQGHGGPVEMSVAKAIRPELVREEWAFELEPEEAGHSAGEIDPLRLTSERGYIGGADEIDEEVGRRLLELAVERSVRAIERALADNG